MDPVDAQEPSKKICPSNRAKAAVFCLHGLLFFSAIVLNSWAFHRLASCSPQGSAVWNGIHQINELSNYPLEQLTTKIPVKFDAELFSTSIYKGRPRKELDDAWGKLVDHPMILADYETLQAFDATETPIKGVNGHYYATIEVFHQLHCLDIIRKFIWRDYYAHIDTFQDPPEAVWEHIDHCIDLLRQVLMCNSGTGLLFYADRGSEQPEARFSTNHMCRNFSQISEWVWKHNSELGIYAES
ncbi:hypothetical protein F4803DRAFT_564584 [Xylaria telfairii]|nr:hypothetical protein F4803DRAFT_564584 [Xylaria telfairii]